MSAPVPPGGPPQGHSITWQVQDRALADLTQKCVDLGLTKDQTLEVWNIVANAFNRLGQARGMS